MSKDPSSLQAAHDEVKHWNQLTLQELKVKTQDWLATKPSVGLAKFDPTLPPSTWPRFVVVTAWDALCDMNQNGEIGFSKKQTTSIGAVWTEPPPTSKADADPDVENFQQDVEKLRMKEARIVSLTEEACLSKLVGMFMADWTHKDSKAKGVHRESLEDYAENIDESIEEALNRADYPGTKVAFCQRAISLFSTSKSDTPEDQQSLASNAQSKAWGDKYGEDQEVAKSKGVTFLSIMTDFIQALEEAKPSIAPSSGASTIGGYPVAQK